MVYKYRGKLQLKCYCLSFYIYFCKYILHQVKQFVNSHINHVPHRLTLCNTLSDPHRTNYPLWHLTVWGLLGNSSSGLSWWHDGWHLHSVEQSLSVATLLFFRTSAWEYFYDDHAGQNQPQIMISSEWCTSLYQTIRNASALRTCAQI